MVPFVEIGWGPSVKLSVVGRRGFRNETLRWVISLVELYTEYVHVALVQFYSFFDPVSLYTQAFCSESATARGYRS